MLHALLHWGDEALARLNGMWAFAFWDPGKQRLLLARDRFGVKPLYYRIGREGLAFVSEPKALLRLFPEHRKVCRPALLDFLANNSLYAGDQSFYDGIRIMPPAHFGILERKQTSCAWAVMGLSRGREPRPTTDDSVAQFATLFEDAVRVRLRSDVPVGLTLSGGLDSTAVLAAATGGRAQAMTCFTSVYSADNPGELEWAQRAESAGRRRVDRGAGASGDLADGPEGRGMAYGRTGLFPGLYPLWCLMQRARSEGVPVLLEGQGADEALAGYPQFRPSKCWPMPRAGMRKGQASPVSCPSSRHALWFFAPLGCGMHAA